MTHSISTDTSFFLRQLPSFEHLNEAQLQQMLACMAPLELPIQAYLFKAGQPYKEAFFILQDGEIELQQPSGQVITLINGELIGLANLLDAAPYTCSAIASQPTRLLSVAVPDLHAMEQNCPALYKALNRLIARHIRDRSNNRQTASALLNVPARAVMTTPLACCSGHMPLVEAFNQIHDRPMGSLGVTDTKGKLIGLVTYASIAEAMLRQGATPQQAVAEIAWELPRTVPPDMPLWQVEEQQQLHRVKYLVVTEADKPLGIISQTDILNVMMTHQGGVLAEVAAADDYIELAHQYQKVGKIAQEARENTPRTSTALRYLSEYHLALQQRCIALVVQEIETELGHAPADYDFFVLGSCSRREALLNPDQDNGIIIADEGLAETQNRLWFEALSIRVNQRLDEIGYPLCTGGIMAKHVAFRKSLSEWKQQLSHIIYLPTEKAARWANIFLDFTVLYGKGQLLTRLQQHIQEELAQHPRLLKMMVMDDAAGQAAVGWFNRLLTIKDDTGKNTVDIKRNGLRIIADAARIYAWQQGISGRHTLDRLNALVRQGVLDTDFAHSVSTAFEELLYLLLNHQIHQWHDQQPLDKLIDPKSLPRVQQEGLRIAMWTIKQLQEKLQIEFDATDI